jgi:hypothetical protein
MVVSQINSRDGHGMMLAMGLAGEPGVPILRIGRRNTCIVRITTVHLHGKNMKNPEPDDGWSAAALIEQKIDELADWRGETLGRIRLLIKEADPGIVEEWKWKTPVWSQGGIICTGETYKAKLKLTFARGASLPDPAGLFNSSLDGKVRRAIDIHEGEQIDATAFKALILAASSLNLAGKKQSSDDPQ